MPAVPTHLLFSPVARFVLRSKPSQAAEIIFRRLEMEHLTPTHFDPRSAPEVQADFCEISLCCSLRALANEMVRLSFEIGFSTTDILWSRMKQAQVEHPIRFLSRSNRVFILWDSLVLIGYRSSPCSPCSHRGWRASSCTSGNKRCWWRNNGYQSRLGPVDDSSGIRINLALCCVWKMIIMAPHQ